MAAIQDEVSKKPQLTVIGLSGKTRHGKDTVASMIQGMASRMWSPLQFSVERQSFADPLKRILLFLVPDIVEADLYTQEGKNKVLPQPHQLFSFVHQQIKAFEDLDEDGMKLVTLGLAGDRSDLTPTTLQALVFEIDMLQFALGNSRFNPSTPPDVDTLTTLGCIADYLAILLDVSIGELVYQILAAIVLFAVHVVNRRLKESPLTIGEALQYLGTDAFRTSVSPDFWIKLQEVNLLYRKNPKELRRRCKIDENVEGVDTTQAMCADAPTAAIFAQKSNISVYTDTRFPNEYEWVKASGGVTIRVKRDAPVNVVETTLTPSSRDPNHPSETALDNYVFDYVIDNNGSLEETQQQVEKILTDLATKFSL